MFEITRDDLREMLEAEKIEMDKHKWIESQKAHCDLGIYAILDWINKYAASWPHSSPIPP